MKTILRTNFPYFYTELVSSVNDPLPEPKPKDGFKLLTTFNYTGDNTLLYVYSKYSQNVEVAECVVSLEVPKETGVLVLQGSVTKEDGTAVEPLQYVAPHTVSANIAGDAVVLLVS
jgi:hypothetical protein